jgi:hypothetical protein
LIVRQPRFTKHRFRAGGGAVFIKAIGGQNSTWTAALFGGGIANIDMEMLREVAPSSIAHVLAVATTDRSRYATSKAMA